MKKIIQIHPTAESFDKEMKKWKVTAISKERMVIVGRKEQIELHVFCENLDLLDCYARLNNATKNFKGVLKSN